MLLSFKCVVEFSIVKTYTKFISVSQVCACIQINNLFKLLRAVHVKVEEILIIIRVSISSHIFHQVSVYTAELLLWRCYARVETAHACMVTI